MNLLCLAFKIHCSNNIDENVNDLLTWLHKFQMVAASLNLMYETERLKSGELFSMSLSYVCRVSSGVSLLFIFDNSSRVSLNNWS